MRTRLKGRAGRAATRENERASRIAKMELRFADWRNDIEDRAKREQPKLDEVVFITKAKPSLLCIFQD
jgi:hypothetical protein